MSTLNSSIKTSLTYPRLLSVSLSSWRGPTLPGSYIGCSQPDPDSKIQAQDSCSSSISLCLLRSSCIISC